MIQAFIFDILLALSADRLIDSKILTALITRLPRVLLYSLDGFIILGLLDLLISGLFLTD